MCPRASRARSSWVAQLSSSSSRAALARAEGGIAGAVFVSGESGIGKTRLLRELERLAVDERILHRVAATAPPSAPGAGLRAEIAAASRLARGLDPGAGPQGAHGPGAKRPGAALALAGVEPRPGGAPTQTWRRHGPGPLVGRCRGVLDRLRRGGALPDRRRGPPLDRPLDARGSPPRCCAACATGASLLVFTHVTATSCTPGIRCSRCLAGRSTAKASSRHQAPATFEPGGLGTQVTGVPGELPSGSRAGGRGSTLAARGTRPSPRSRCQPPAERRARCPPRRLQDAHTPPGGPVQDDAHRCCGSAAAAGRQAGHRLLAGARSSLRARAAGSASRRRRASHTRPRQGSYSFHHALLDGRAPRTSCRRSRNSATPRAPPGAEGQPKPSPRASPRRQAAGAPLAGPAHRVPEGLAASVQASRNGGPRQVPGVRRPMPALRRRALDIQDLVAKADVGSGLALATVVARAAHAAHLTGERRRTGSRLGRRTVKLADGTGDAFLPPRSARASGSASPPAGPTAATMPHGRVRATRGASSLFRPPTQALRRGLAAEGRGSSFSAHEPRRHQDGRSERRRPPGAGRRCRAP